MTIWTAQQNLPRAQQALQSGRLAEAEVLCRQAVSASPRDANALHLLGVILSQLKRHEEAISMLAEANQLSPKNHVFLTNLGAAYAANDEFVTAAEYFRQAISIKPSIPESHYNLGNALKDLGELEHAVAAYRKALQLRTNYPAAWSNLGAAYIQLAKSTEAKSAVNRALALNPNSPSSLNNLANICRNEGDLAKAVEHSRRAISTSPSYAEAYFTLGSAMIATLDYTNAIKAYEKGASLKPAAKSVLFELADGYSACGLHEKMVEVLEKILTIDPHDARAAKYLGITQMERGHYEASATAFRQVMNNSDDPVIRVVEAMTMPPIVSCVEDIVQIRAALNEKLDVLFGQNGVITDPYTAPLRPNFFLAYHAMNDRAVQSKIATLYRKFCPSLNFVAPHCRKMDSPKPRVKVGFFSRFIYKHSVAISFGSVISELSQRDDIEAYLISTTDHSNAAVKDMYAEFSGALVCIPQSLMHAQLSVAHLELDVLIYLDIGMDPLSFLLAFARLAPAQCVMGGHPDTTGIDTMDYYLSAGQAEPNNADDHYSEKLVRLNSGGFSLPRPTVPTSPKTRAELRLPESGNLYLCPMMLQKLHPDFDSTISRILELDPSGFVVLFESFQHPRWGELIRERLNRQLKPEVRHRAVFLPWITDPGDFMSAIALSDVILDPFHFGIGTTGVFTLAVGTPIVTMPGEFLRGRVGLLYCKLLDMMECVASTPEEYAQKAVQIATDKPFHESLKMKILANNHAIFDNKQSATELAEFIHRAARESREAPGAKR